MITLIYNSNNVIGNFLINYLSQNNNKCFVGQEKLDNFKKLLTEIKLSKCTNVIIIIYKNNNNSIVFDDINYNLVNPIILSQVCIKLNIHLTYITNQDTFYVRNAEKILHSNLVLKLSKLVLGKNYEDEDYIVNIINNKQSTNNKVKLSILEDLLPVIEKLIKSCMIGNYEIVNDDVISNKNIMELYKEIVDNNLEWINVICNEYIEEIIFDNSKLKYVYPELNNVNKAIRNILINYK